MLAPGVSPGVAVAAWWIAAGACVALAVLFALPKRKALHRAVDVYAMVLAGVVVWALWPVVWGDG